MLSIFSCAYWPSVFILWSNVYLCLLPMFYLDWILLLFNCMSCFYILEISPCLSHCLQIFFPVLRLFFNFVYGFLCCAELLRLIGFHLFIFTFISIALEDRLKKTLVQFMSHNVLPMFYSGSFMVPFLLFKKCHFEVAFVCGERVCSDFLDLLIYMWLSSFTNTTYWKRLCFLHCIFLPPLSD